MTFNFRELLRTLTSQDVDFVIVGGLAGVIQATLAERLKLAGG